MVIISESEYKKKKYLISKDYKYATDALDTIIYRSNTFNSALDSRISFSPLIITVPLTHNNDMFVLFNAFTLYRPIMVSS